MCMEGKDNFFAINQSRALNSYNLPVTKLNAMAQLSKVTTQTHLDTNNELYKSLSQSFIIQFLFVCLFVSFCLFFDKIHYDFIDMVNSTESYF